MGSRPWRGCGSADGTLPVIMMSGKAQLTDAVRAIKLGAFQFLEKPLTPEAVLVTVRSALELHPRPGGEPRAPRRAGAAGGTGRRERGACRGARADRPGGARPKRECSSSASRAPARSWWPPRSTREPAGGPAVRHGQLRRDPARPGRVGDVRPRAGRVHRRDRSAARPVRAGPRRHALPRRGRRPEPEAQAKLLRMLETGEVQRLGAENRPRRRPGDRRDQPAAGRGSGRRDVPRGPLLPPERLPDRAAAASRAAGGPARAGGASGRAGAAAPARRGSPPRRWTCCRRTPGRATCASWPTSWSGSPSSAARRWTPPRCGRCCAAARPPAAPLRRAAGAPLSEALDDYERGSSPRRSRRPRGTWRRRRGCCRPIVPTCTAACGGSGLDEERAATAVRPTSPTRVRMRLLAGGLLLLLRRRRCSGRRTASSSSTPTRRRRLASSGRARRPRWSRSWSRRYNDSATTRVQGDVTLPGRKPVRGPVAMYRGTLRIAGRIEGDDHRDQRQPVHAAGRGGRGRRPRRRRPAGRAAGARHTGRERVYWDAAPVLRTPDGVLVLRERRRPLGDLATARRSFQTGRVRTTLLLATGGTYNRVEGLPIVFGPTFSSGPRQQRDARARPAGHAPHRKRGDRPGSDFGFWRAPSLGLGAPRAASAAALRQVDADRGPAALAGEVGWAAFLSGATIATTSSSRAAAARLWVQPYPAAPVRAARSAGTTRAVGAGHRSVVAVPEQRSLAPQSADRRRPLLHHRRSRSTSTPATSATTPTSGWCFAARYEQRHQRRRGAGDAAGDGAARRSRPAAATPSTGCCRSPAILADHTSLRVNARVRADGWVGGDRLPVQRRVSLGGPDLLPGLRLPRLHLRPRGIRRPGGAGALRPHDRRPGRGPDAAGPQPRLPHARPRGRRRGRFIGIEEADLVFLADAGKAWLAGDGPGQVPVNRIPVARRVEVRRRGRARRGRDRRLPREEARRGRAGAVHRPAAAPVLVRAGRSSRFLARRSVRLGGRAWSARRRAAPAPCGAQAAGATHVRLAADSTPQRGARAGRPLGESAGATAAGCRRCARGCRCGCTTGWRSGARGSGWFDAFERQAEWDVVRPARAAAGPVHAAHAGRRAQARSAATPRSTR